MYLLEAKNISKNFEGTEILKDLSLHLDPGELTCIVGASGIGKTTLFNIMSGLLSPDSGNIYLEGKDITGQTGHLSYMQQKDLLLPYKTVLDNVALPLILKRQPKKAAHKAASAHFDEFGLTGYENAYPHKLSGGMRQRAAFLRAYLYSSSVMLLDEPFGALDAITRNGIHQWYLNIAKRFHISTLFITHDIDEAVFLSNRIYVISGRPGNISYELTIERPNNIKDFRLCQQFIDYKKLVLSVLEKAQ